MADELARFRRLVTVTIVATLVLILIGGIVRVSDSGLGCGPAGSGTHGWPLCEGGVLPADLGRVGDRVQPPDRRRRRRGADRGDRLACPAPAARAPLARPRLDRRRRPRPAQAALGGLTVEQGLEEELVAAHLGLAMLLLGLLIALRRAADPEAAAPPPESVRGLRALTARRRGAGAGDDRRRRLRRRDRAGGHAGRAGRRPGPRGLRHRLFGRQFPACNGQFPGFGQSRLADIQLIHRALMYLAAIAVLAMAAVALVRRAPEPRLLAGGAAVAGQIALGASTSGPASTPG